jgi:hypothetical protein
MTRGAGLERAAGIDFAAGAALLPGGAAVAPPAETMMEATATATTQTAEPAVKRNIVLNSHVAAKCNAPAMDLVPLPIVSWHRLPMKCVVMTW